MRTRFILALCAIFVSTIPAQAEPPKPTVVVAAKPISRLLTEYREMLRQVGGPVQGELLVKEFENDLKEMFGEHGFEGIDLDRPLAAYSVVREKFRETNLVLVVPVTGEKEFLALLERLKIKSAPVKDKKGLHKLEFIGPGFLTSTPYVQFTDGGWAYVALNGDEVSDAKNRLPLEDLFDNADLSLFTVKLFPERFPEKLLKSWLEEMENTANGIKRFVGMGVPMHIVKLAQTFLEEGPKLLRRYAETGLKEAAEVRIQFSWEPMTGETFTELVLTPKAGTPLAKEIAAKAATTHRFAGIAQANVAVGVAVKVPLFAKEIQEIVAAGVEAIEGEAKTTDIPNSFHPFLEELAKSAIQSVKKGDLDVALALVGPDKGGKFTVQGAISLVDPTPFEKALRQAAKSAELAKLFEFDVAKVGGVSIHKVPLARAANEEQLRELSRLFGENPPGYVAFAKDAAFVSFGPDGLAAIKAAIEAKPGPAPVVELTGNMNRLHKLIASMAGEQVAGMYAKFIGTDDKAVSMLRVTVEGGQTLKAKATVNVRYLPKFILTRGQTGNAPPVGK
ncbi:MAG TPA: hypothetical protein VG122_12225 [Gemmata sp.]|jgi:hypothetical protein|nr:hypothetical protein [Gemmata sp.]